MGWNEDPEHEQRCELRSHNMAIKAQYNLPSHLTSQQFGFWGVLAKTDPDFGQSNWFPGVLLRTVAPSINEVLNRPPNSTVFAQNLLYWEVDTWGINK